MTAWLVISLVSIFLFVIVLMKGLHRQEKRLLENEVRHWRTAFDELYAKSKYAHLVPDPLSAKSVIQRQQKARKRALTLKQEISRLTRPAKYRGEA